MTRAERGDTNLTADLPVSGLVVDEHVAHRFAGRGQREHGAGRSSWLAVATTIKFEGQYAGYTFAATAGATRTFNVTVQLLQRQLSPDRMILYQTRREDRP